MVSIKGLQKTTLVDFPGHVACTVFISSCNFRCGYCHNKELVDDSDSLKEYSEKELFDFLDSRKGKLDGVCFTGGEPTLYKNLKGIISKIKNKGFKVKLDTNGMRPDILKEVIDLVDFVAMDIKSSKDKYSDVCGVNVDISKIEESVKLIIDSAKDYEFRTTVIPEFFSKDDAESIAKWLKGSKRYSLQQFIAEKGTLDPRFEDIKPYNIDELNELKTIMEPFIDEVEVKA